MKHLIVGELANSFNLKELMEMSDRLDSMIYYYFYLDGKIQEPLFNLMICCEEAINEVV